MDFETYNQSTRYVQATLSVRNPGVRIDGKYGTFTRGAYAKASPVEREMISVALKAKGITTGDLERYRDNQRKQEVAADPAWVSKVRTDAAVERAVHELGLPDSSIPVLQSFLDIEANKRDVNGVRFYDPRSVNGRSRGIGQLQPAAWQSAASVVSLKPYEVGVFDYAENIRAMVGYVKWLVTRYKVDPTRLDEVYVTYNQGPGVLSGTVTGFDGQSPAARSMVKRLILRRRLTPKFVDTPKYGHKSWDATN